LASFAFTVANRLGEYGFDILEACIFVGIEVNEPMLCPPLPIMIVNHKSYFLQGRLSMNVFSRDFHRSFFQSAIQIQLH